MLVTIAIIVLIVGAAIASFRKSQYRNALDQSSRQLVEAIQSSRAASLSGKTLATLGHCQSDAGLACDPSNNTVCTVPDVCVTDVPKGGYGIIIHSGKNAEDHGRKFTLYADVNANGLFSPGDQTIETQPMVGNVYVSSLTADGVEVEDLAITFVPPTARLRIVYDNAGTPKELISPETASFTLTNLRGSESISKTVILTPGEVGTIRFSD